jgi:hypothetical protein
MSTLHLAGLALATHAICRFFRLHIFANFLWNNLSFHRQCFARSLPRGSRATGDIQKRRGMLGFQIASEQAFFKDKKSN